MSDVCGTLWTAEVEVDPRDRMLQQLPRGADQRGLLEKATASRTAFLEIVGRPVSNTREDASVQPSLLSGLL